MGRTVRNGLGGQPGFGQVSFSASTITTTQANTDLSIDPDGTGRVLITGDAQLQSQGDLRFADADSSNWVAFQAPATVTSNVTWTLPSSDGTANQALVTNASGTLSWSTERVTVTDETASSNVHYMLLYPQASYSSAGQRLDAVNVSSSRIFFQPSTGALFSAIHTGGTSSGGNLTLRSTSNATKGYVYIDETTVSTSTTTGALRVGGGVGIAGTLYVTSLVETSSITIKENLNPITEALEKIMQLVGYTYDRTDTNAKNEAGLIAEQVEKVIPQVVNKDENGNANGIQYGKLSAYLIEAIKTLNAEITELKSKIR